MSTKPPQTDSEIARKLEQMRGIGYAKSLVDALILTMEGEVEFRKEDEQSEIEE